ncbi:MAG: sigma-70 family RNA polymerase sigma factor [Planctomycetota bacterium]
MSDQWRTRKSLILRARNPDDSQAWEDFVQYYERFIFHVLHRMNVAAGDFDDLVQNVLLKLWRSIASYDATKARFRTWLGVVVRNAVYDQFAETQRRRKLLEQEREALQRLEQESPSEVERWIEQEWAGYVTSLAMERIEKLFSEKAVSAFTMSHDGVAANEIATKLNLSNDSVYTLKSRVKARLIKEIKAVINELEG